MTMQERYDAEARLATQMQAIMVAQYRKYGEIRDGYRNMAAGLREAGNAYASDARVRRLWNGALEFAHMQLECTSGWRGSPAASLAGTEESLNLMAAEMTRTRILQLALGAADSDTWDLASDDDVELGA